MRQWDTKKQFKPRYGMVAGIVFLGILKAFQYPDWRYTLQDLGRACWRLWGHLGGIVLAILLLVLSPVTFPLLCLVEFSSTRRARLDYLRSNRQADEDI